MSLVLEHRILGIVFHCTKRFHSFFVDGFLRVIELRIGGKNTNVLCEFRFLMKDSNPESQQKNAFIGIPSSYNGGK